MYTPGWSVHSKATLLPLPLECTLQPHSEYHRCALGCHSIDLVKSLTNTPIQKYTPNTTPSALQMECTLHCHSYNLVFSHAHTSTPLRGLYIFVHKIATLQCHSMHLNIFTLKNIHSNATSRTCAIYALCWAYKFINWSVFETTFIILRNILWTYWPQIKFTIWQQKSINRYVCIIKLILHYMEILHIVTNNFIFVLMILSIQVAVLFL